MWRPMKVVLAILRGFWGLQAAPKGLLLACLARCKCEGLFFATARSRDHACGFASRRAQACGGLLAREFRGEDYNPGLASTLYRLSSLS